VTAVAERLAAEVAAQRMEFDGAQTGAARRLDALCAALRGAPAGRWSRLRARLPWLPGGRTAPRPRGVYLWGGVGRGKTLLMDWFFAALTSAAPDSGNVAAERQHFYHFMRAVHAELKAIKQHADPLERVAQTLAARARVICLDEFFVGDIADAMILGRLFGALFRRGVTLVATSNLPPQDLYPDGLQRQRFLPAIALLQKHLDVIHLDGGVDYRLRQLEQAPTYLDSTAPATRTALAARFAALSGGDATGPVELAVEGRTLRAVNSGHGIVWFEFTELCMGPRSQNDYIELAHLYHTLFIANIPVFDRRDENAARRFIMLIDELYDRGVKLVVSAAAPPAELYRGERLSFEFERAASRLIEMQTQQYLASQHRP
jgi:cell division protein ZapE